MTYHAGAALGDDEDFWRRVAFCSQVEGLGWDWGHANRYAVAASPGFADSYQYALDTGVENPGKDQAVISDAQILSAVQAEAP